MKAKDLTFYSNKRLVGRVNKQAQRYEINEGRWLLNPPAFLSIVCPDAYFNSIFLTSHNYAFTHEWQRYVSYMFLFFLCDYYKDIKTIADIWNYHETSVKDFNQVLMDMKGINAEELYKLHFEYALKARSFRSPVPWIAATATGSQQKAI